MGPVVVIISATAATSSEILRTNRFLEVNRPLRQLLLSDSSIANGVKDVCAGTDHTKSARAGLLRPREETAGGLLYWEKL